MGFLSAFTEEQRALFESTGQLLEISRGDYLIRRGEPGGDLFLIQSGRLEAVDTRQTPETVLSVLDAGTVVGEMAFIDGSPRSVDVRAADDSTVLRWVHHDLKALLRREPVFAAAFYETVASLATHRMRRLNDTAAAGRPGGGDAAGFESTLIESRALAAQVKRALMRSEIQLRADPNDQGAEEALRDEVFNLQTRLNALLEAWPEEGAREVLSEELRRELHPYLVRSTLADRCIRRPGGVVGTAETLSHVLVGRASGEGRLGEIVDQWLLDSPTLTALKGLTHTIPSFVAEGLPTNRNRRVLVLNAGTGSLVARLAHTLDRAPTTVTVVDPSRSALAFLDTDVVPIHSNVTIEAKQENLAEMAVGRMRNRYAQQDVVVLHGLLEYLPDRLAVSLLATVATLLNAQGRVISAALSDSADAAMFDRLLRWPTIRRSPDALARLHQAARFQGARFADIAAPAVLFGAQAPVARGSTKR